MAKYIGKVPRLAQRTEQHDGQCRCPITPALIRKDLLKYNNSCNEMPDNIYLKVSISKACHAFHLDQKIKMIHLNEVFQQNDLDIWDKSPGLPWLAHGYKTTNDIRKDTEVINRIRHFWSRIKRSEDLRPPDCLACTQSHNCPDGKQVRAKWEYPATMTFGEAVYCIPLIKAYQDFGPFISINKTVSGISSPELNRKLFKRFQQYKNYCRLDFKEFDKTVPAWLIKKAFLILLTNINYVEYENHGVADARRMYHMYNYLSDYFINTTIRTVNGIRFKKNTGIPSGSYFTHLITSICNYILCQWMTLEQTGAAAQDIVVHCDELLMATALPLDMNKCDQMMESIGMKINIERSQITNELSIMNFLGCRIDNGDTIIS